MISDIAPSRSSLVTVNSNDVQSIFMSVIVSPYDTSTCSPESFLVQAVCLFDLIKCMFLERRFYPMQHVEDVVVFRSKGERMFMY